MSDQTPLLRARRAAQELISAGETVTSRILRDRARVSMAVAVQVAREVNAPIQPPAAAVPMPEDVSDVFDQVWQRAVEAAKQDQASQIEELTKRAHQAETERDDLALLVIDLEAKLEDRAQAVRSAEDRARSAEGLAAGLREALVALNPGESK